MMKSLAVGVVAAAVLTAGGVAMAASGEEVVKSSGCLNCHAVDTKKMGPAFKDVGAKFAGKKDADVVAAIKAAKPHSSLKASDDDLKSVAGWILTLK
jgi:cytochrome c